MASADSSDDVLPLTTLLGHLPAAVAYLHGPDLRFAFANDDYISLVGGRDVVGLPIRAALPEIEGQGYFEMLEAVLAGNGPTLGREAAVDIDRGAGRERRFVDFVYQPVPDGRGGVSGVLVHAVDVTAHVETRKALERLAADLAVAEARHRRLFETLPAAVVYQDRQGKIISVNPAAVDILGVDKERLLGRESHDRGWGAVREDGSPFPGDEHPAMVALRTGLSVSGVIMGVRHGRTGERRWLEVTAVPDDIDADGVPQRVYTISADVTDARRAQEAIAESERMLKRLRDSNVLAIVVADEQAIRDANDVFLEMVGFTREDLEQGRIRWRDMTPPEWDAVDDAALRQLQTTGTCAPFEKEYLHRDGHRVPVLLGAATIRQDPLTWIVYIIDLTAQRRAQAERAAAAERERAAAAAAAAATEQVGFLLRAGSILAATRDRDELVRHAAELLVPGLGDWSAVLSGGGEPWLRIVAAAHADTDGVRHLDKLVGQSVSAVSALAAPRAFRTGRTWVVRDFPSEVDLTFESPALSSAVRELQPGSVVAAPLVVGEHILGVLSVVRAAGREPFSDDDAALVTELARQLATGLRNAELSAHEHSVAEALQRAVLPDRLPDVERLRLSATYLPATEGVSVGGDFFDAFELGPQRVGLVIGDVVGHDINAASVMGQLRNGLRMVAALGADPAETLQQTQQALDRLWPGALATVWYGVVDTATGEVTFANAGHVPPLVVSGGSSAFLDDPAAPMLGAAPTAAIPLGRHRLAAGASMVLYTDGLIEDRHRDLTDGMRDLLWASTSAPPHADLCESVIAALLGSRTRADDVCVLVARWDGG